MKTVTEEEMDELVKLGVVGPHWRTVSSMTGYYMGYEIVFKDHERIFEEALTNLRESKKVF